MDAFEKEYKILPLSEVMDSYNEHFPKTDLNKLQIEYEGPFLKYEMVGNDGTHRNTLELNAQTGEVLKDKQKPLKEKDQDPAKRDSKALNMNQLLPLEEINKLALENSEVQTPFQWEMDREGERSVWKIELADDTGGQVTELKIDAQDGTVVQMKLKN